MAQAVREYAIILVGHYWDLVPEYSVYCDDKLICRREIPAESGVPYVEQFQYDNAKTIRVQFENKASDQSVLNLNRDRLIRDMLLEVQGLTIDHVPFALTQNCVYVFDQKQLYQGKLLKQVPHITTMGFNGVLYINIP